MVETLRNIQRGRIGEERFRDLRDYAMINGFYRASDFEDSLKAQFKKGDTILDLGCKEGRGTTQMARALQPLGVKVLAQDQNPPREKYRHIKYLQGTPTHIDAENNSVKGIFSVCELFYYAENKEELLEHVQEAKRVLTPDGKISAVVYPVIFIPPELDRERSELTYELRSLKDSSWYDPDRQRVVQELKKNRTSIQTASELQRLNSEEVWVRSPTVEFERKHFRTNIFKLLDMEGFAKPKRIIPRGGMGIDNQITLVISKKK